MASSGLAEGRINLISPLVPGLTPETTTNGTKTTQEDPQWDWILAELLRLRSLPPDWDGQGATALDPVNVDQAIAWVKAMRTWEGALAPTRAVPGVTGEVILEWRGGTFYLAAEIAHPSQIEWVLTIPGQGIKQWDTDTRCTWIVQGER